MTSSDLVKNYCINGESPLSLKSVECYLEALRFDHAMKRAEDTSLPLMNNGLHTRVVATCECAQSYHALG